MKPKNHKSYFLSPVATTDLSNYFKDNSRGSDTVIQLYVGQF